ncbi:MAG: NTP transferase domain-containing protein [Chthoniobacter sp.]
MRGRDGARIEGELRGRNAVVVHHEHWELGIGSSIRVGVARALEISPDLDSLVVLVCDQPHVTADLVASLRQMQDKERKPIVACGYAGSAGVPALFARSLFPKLLSLRDGGGAREIILQGGAEVALVPFPEGAIDIDTPADALAYLDGGKV